MAQPPVPLKQYLRKELPTESNNPAFGSKKYPSILNHSHCEQILLATVGHVCINKRQYFRGKPLSLAETNRQAAMLRNSGFEDSSA